MQSMSAKDAKYGFGRLIDLARAEPVTVEKHGRPVVVVLAIEEYEKLREIANEAAAPTSARVKRPRKSGGTVNT
jgi:prevent-host-death family protein